VDLQAWNGAGFEGALYPPGARIDLEPGSNPVLLEYAGPQGNWRQRRLEGENLWILWRYDWAAMEWREVARAVARDWHWALVLREPAIQELAAANMPGMDPVERGREVTDEILRAIDAALTPEVPAVRKAVLTSIYDRMAGRIVAA
jgi:hypothetical protein